MEPVAPTNKQRGEPQEREGGPARRPAVRGIYLVIWAIATVALLAEYGFTVGDFRRVRKSAEAISMRLSDEGEEPGEASRPGDRDPKAAPQDLRPQLEARDQEIARLKEELSKAASDLYDRSLGTQPAAVQAVPDAAPPSKRTAPAAEGPRTSRRPEAREEPAAAQEAPAAPKVRGRLIVREPGTEYAAVDLGFRDGLRQGMRLPLKAAGQDVGTFIVLEVRSAVAAGRVVTHSGRTVDDAVQVEK